MPSLDLVMWHALANINVSRGVISRGLKWADILRFVLLHFYKSHKKDFSRLAQEMDQKHLQHNWESPVITSEAVLDQSTASHPLDVWASPSNISRATHKTNPDAWAINSFVPLIFCGCLSCNTIMVIDTNTKPNENIFKRIYKEVRLEKFLL